ncbi:MAG: acyl-CoA reductase, partial [Firmicutes bacterium]|nr:acyl-CoA reductase [Bacillota bacterium]
VVWGGDEAVRSIRRITEPDTKIIEWGHKLSFAYLCGDFMHWSVESELKGLARHIFRTQQLLTSSCQTIYLDTDDPEKQKGFCERFLPILEAEFVAEKAADNVISEGTLQRFTARQEERVSLPSETDYKAEHCMLTACEDQALEGSGRFGHVLVKRLPEEDIVSVLSPYNGYLHTAGVLEGGTKIQELQIHAGVTRITRLGDMSRYFDGEAHDGVFPLELYTKIVDIQR